MFRWFSKNNPIEATALYHSSLNVMMADTNYNITYINEALRAFLKCAEKDIRKFLPHFNVDTLIGTNIDVFHKNPGHIRKILDELKEPRHSSVQLGDAIFYQRVVPLFDDAGRRAGTMVEWDNPKTLENDGQIKALSDSFIVVHFDLNGNVLDANKNFCACMGYTLEEIKGKHHRTFVPPEESEKEVYRLFWESLAQGQTKNAVARRLTKNGQIVWLDASYVPVFTNTGKIYKVIKYAHDVTEQKNCAFQLSQNIKHLASVLASSSTELQATAQSLASTNSHGHILQRLTQASSTIAEADQEAGNSKEKMSELLRMAEKIGGSTNIIAQIAGKTNLLALNATIESARAGEAGKGFAVVASEVKVLANQTSRATDDITQQVEGIQMASKHVADTIDKIVTVVARIRETSAVVSEAVQQQAATVEEVTSNLVAVSHDVAERSSRLDMDIEDFIQNS